MSDRDSGYMGEVDSERVEMPRPYGLAAISGLLGLVMLGCTPRVPSALQDLQNVAPPSPSPTVAPVPTPTPPPREILPFRSGDHFAFDIRYMLNGFIGLPVGVLALDVQRVAYVAGVETIDLTLSAAGKTEAHRIVLEEGMFHYDGKPFIPDHMRPGDSWPAQDGYAQVTERESISVPADFYPGCYPVIFTNPRNERLLLWFAPEIGLVKGDFKLSSFGQGRIELRQKPTNLQLGL